MEAFGSFQGETSNDVPISKRERNDSRAKQEFKLIKEHYESFITLKSQNRKPPSTGLGFSSMYDSLSASDIYMPGDRYDSIQGAVHTLGLLVTGVQRVLSLPLPYRLRLTPLGFQISDTHRVNNYPLYLKRAPTECMPDPKHLNLFDTGIVLLDKNI